MKIAFQIHFLIRRFINPSYNLFFCHKIDFWLHLNFYIQPNIHTNSCFGYAYTFIISPKNTKNRVLAAYHILLTAKNIK
jgi:hypothetical protein